MLNFYGTSVDRQEREIITHLKDYNWKNVSLKHNSDQTVTVTFKQKKSDGNLAFRLTGPIAEVANFVCYFLADDIHM